MSGGATTAPLRGQQIDRLRRLLGEALPGNRFYARKLAAAGVGPDDLRGPDDLARLPFTTKAELAVDQTDFPPYGTALSLPAERYARLHQSSGTTTGRPLRWLDTPESWAWATGCWETHLVAWMGLVPGRDRLFFPFSFGPFYGFWTAWDAAVRAGFLCLSGGGMPTTARARALVEHRATVVFATPTYALHLAEVAAKEGVDLPGSAVRAVVVAGEPGAGVEGTRQKIAAAWGARVFDQYGLTEVGPVAGECEADPGALRVLEPEYLAEVLTPNGPDPVPAGEVGELVLTGLGRVGSPLIRYRTGDLVRADPDPRPVPGVPPWLRLIGGVLGRVDDMIHVRGNNLYPSAVEAIVRRFPGVAEFRLVVNEASQLTDVRVEVEPAAGADGESVAAAVGRAVRDELLFRAEVVAVPPDSLPRFEMKARRVVRGQRKP